MMHELKTTMTPKELMAAFDAALAKPDPEERATRYQVRENAPSVDDGCIPVFAAPMDWRQVPSMNALARRARKASEGDAAENGVDGGEF